MARLNAPECRRILRPLLLLTAAALVFGCATGGFQSAERLAADNGAFSRLFQSESNSHRVYSHSGKGSILRIYIGGDGQAFLNRHSVSADPTPRLHMALELMLSDPGPAIFVSRPCYYGTAGTDNCPARLWTTERYSQTVVNSIAQVIEQLSAGLPGKPIHLVGYSGGGVIAMLLAPRIKGLTQVVTIAAPLDTDAWTRQHGYTSFSVEQNPAKLEQWPKGVRQIHLSGARDRNVSPELQDRFRRQMRELGAKAEFHTIADYDHNCCWQQNWPALLRQYNL